MLANCGVSLILSVHEHIAINIYLVFKYSDAPFSLLEFDFARVLRKTENRTFIPVCLYVYLRKRHLVKGV